MKLLANTTDYDTTIKLAKDLSGVYDKPVAFHCYWDGALNEKHLYSVISCYVFNVKNNKHKIIVWLENNTPNEYNLEIAKYAEIRYFSLAEERIGLFLEKTPLRFLPQPSYYSDVVRYIILYKYGGCWFDLDCLILRNFEPIFKKFENEICVYTWATQQYPNGAIYISLEPNSEKMKHIIEFIIARNRGWGFQEANLTFNLPLDMLVLPCSWFDSSWIVDTFRFNDFFTNTDKKFDLTNFFPGAFCYHWHNKWNMEIHENSPFRQLVDQIIKKL